MAKSCNLWKSLQSPWRSGWAHYANHRINVCWTHLSTSYSWVTIPCPGVDWHTFSWRDKYDLYHRKLWWSEPQNSNRAISFTFFFLFWRLEIVLACSDSAMLYSRMLFKMYLTRAGFALRTPVRVHEGCGFKFRKGLPYLPPRWNRRTNADFG